MVYQNETPDVTLQEQCDFDVKGLQIVNHKTNEVDIKCKPGETHHI